MLKNDELAVCLIAGLAVFIFILYGEYVVTVNVMRSQRLEAKP